MSFRVQSDVFKEGKMIPSKFTCDGKNISPPLEWMQVPQNTKSFALIFEDPDAPVKTWTHWLLYNIPANQTVLEEAIPNDKVLENGSIHGMNDFKKYGYGGPCPPSGTHRYFLKLYALDSELDLDHGATRKQLLEAIEDHILGNAELMGRYQRQ